MRFGKDVYKYVGVKGVRQTPSAIELLGNPAKAHVLEAESSGKIKMVSGVVLDSLERLPETRPVQIQKTSPPPALTFCSTTGRARERKFGYELRATNYPRD